MHDSSVSHKKLSALDDLWGTLGLFELVPMVPVCQKAGIYRLGRPCWSQQYIHPV